MLRGWVVGELGQHPTILSLAGLTYTYGLPLNWCRRQVERSIITTAVLGPVLILAVIFTVCLLTPRLKPNLWAFRWGRHSTLAIFSSSLFFLKCPQQVNSAAIGPLPLHSVNHFGSITTSWNRMGPSATGTWPSVLSCGAINPRKRAKRIWWVLYRWRIGAEAFFYPSHSHSCNRHLCVQTAIILLYTSRPLY